MFDNDAHLRSSAQILKALGNYYRLQIVYLLLNGEKNVSELNKTVKVSQPALSQHLAKLRRVGVVAFRRDSRELFYYISNPHVIRLVGTAAEAKAA